MRRSDRLVRRGVAGAVLAFVVLGALQALTVPVFQPPDEASHWGYARLVSEGRLPTIGTLIPVEGVERAEQAVSWRSTRNYRTVWVANHPPLYYVVMALPVRVGIEIGHPVGAVQVARVLSALLAAGGIVMIAGMVREIVPGRPELAVAAAGLAAAVPAFVKTASNLYNDSLAFLTAMAALLLAVRIVLRGPTGLRVVLLALAASAASLSRASGLVVAGVAGLAVVVSPFLPTPPGARRKAWGARVAEALRHGTVVGGAVAATAGWFYLRNLREYGDLTGARSLLDYFSREHRATIPELLSSWEYWRDQLRNLADYTFNMVAESGPSGWLWLLAALPALGLLVRALRRLGRLVTRELELPEERPAGARARRATVLALLVLVFALVEVALAQFARDGGSPHARYLLPTLALLAMVAAAGLAALPGGRRGLPTSALLAGMTVVNLWLWNQYLWIVLPDQPDQHTIEAALAAAGAPDPVNVLAPAGAVLVLALVLQASALWSLGAAPAPSPPPPLTFRVERPADEPEDAERGGGEPEEEPEPVEALPEAAEATEPAQEREGTAEALPQPAEPEER